MTVPPNKFDGEPRFVQLSAAEVPEFASKIADDFEKADRMLGLPSIPRDEMEAKIRNMVYESLIVAD